MFETQIGHEYYRGTYRRRSRLDISLDLLRAVSKGVKKPTRISYAINIPWVSLQKSLASMMSAGFITEIEMKESKRSMKHYEITQSGLNVLHYVDKGKDLLNLIESTHSV